MAPRTNTPETVAAWSEAVTANAAAERARLDRRPANDVEALDRAALDASERYHAAQVASLGVQSPAHADPHVAGLFARARAESPVSKIVHAAVEGAAVDGATAELQAAIGGGGHSIPLDLIFPQMAVSPAPSTVGTEQVRPILPVFAMGDAGFLGITMRRVPSGDLAVPVLTTRPTVGREDHDSSDAISETTGAFTAGKLEPQRLQAGFSFRRTEAAQLMGMEQSLAAALSSALQEEVDHLVWDTIISALTVANSSGHLTFATWRSTAYGLVEGRHAAGISDVGLLVGSAAYADMASVYNSDGDMSALASLMGEGCRIKVSVHAPAPASKRQTIIGRRGMMDDATVAMWPSVSLIRDEITRAGEGEIKLTAVMLADAAVTRSDGFAEIGAQIQP